MMQPWFEDARFGIFLHWGVYSVDGTPESWCFFNGQMSYEEYMAQKNRFGAEKYDPKAWAELFKKSGADYAVLTAKHHDGFALWPTKLSELNASNSPAKRDLIGPYCDALREKDIRVGIYFSHLDWSHPDYRAFKRPPGSDLKPGDKFVWSEDDKDHPERWQGFLDFQRGQLKELCENYKPDLLWFDGDWLPESKSWEFDKTRDLLHKWQPKVVLNSRLGEHGDYKTPEQALPIKRPEGPWEFCMTVNSSWGWQPSDTNYKSVGQIVEIFVECISKGGRLLLGIGPKADGSIDERYVSILESIGAWIERHKEAVQHANEGLGDGHYHGPTMLSKDGKKLYLFTPHILRREMMLKGLHNKDLTVKTLGNGKACHYWQSGGAPWLNVPGVTYIRVEKEDLDEYMTVVEISDAKDEVLSFYTGAGQAITQN